VFVVCLGISTERNEFKFLWLNAPDNSFLKTSINVKSSSCFLRRGDVFGQEMRFGSYVELFGQNYEETHLEN
jgi:hypothetical protein